MPFFDDLDAMRPKILPPDCPTENNFYTPYIVCNEQFQPVVLSGLSGSSSSSSSSTAKAPIKSLHIGFSIWFNLDIIVTTRPDYALIFDIDPSVYLFVYPTIKKAITNSNSRMEFKEQLLSDLFANEFMYPWKEVCCEKFNSLMTASYGFLANDGNFFYLKEIIANNQVFFGKCDLANVDDMNRVREFTNTNQLALTSLYLSNIFEWLFQQSPSSVPDAKQSVQKLLQPCTKLIDAFYPTTKKDFSGPPLRITEGEKLPSFHVEKYNFKKTRSSMFQESRTVDESKEDEQAHLIKNIGYISKM